VSGACSSGDDGRTGKEEGGLFLGVPKDGATFSAVDVERKKKVPSQGALSFGGNAARGERGESFRSILMMGASRGPKEGDDPRATVAKKGIDWEGKTEWRWTSALPPGGKKNSPWGRGGRVKLDEGGGKRVMKRRGKITNRGSSPNSNKGEGGFDRRAPGSSRRRTSAHPHRRKVGFRRGRSGKKQSVCSSKSTGCYQPHPHEIISHRE